MLRFHRPQTYISSITSTQILHLNFLNLMVLVTNCDSTVSIIMHFTRSVVNGIFQYYKNIYDVPVAFYFAVFRV